MVNLYFIDERKLVILLGFEKKTHFSNTWKIVAYARFLVYFYPLIEKRRHEEVF